MSSTALEALSRVLDEGGEPDDALRAAVDLLAAEPRIDWAGIAFLEDGELVLGPAAGAPDEAARSRAPILFQGARVGELWVDGETERPFLEQFAALIAGHVLIGWDTAGEPWDP